MAGANRNHHIAGLLQPAADPAGPIGIAPGQQRSLELRRIAEVGVEALGDALDVATGPWPQHALELPLHRRGIVEHCDQELALWLLR